MIPTTSDISRTPVRLSVGILSTAAAVALLYFGRVFFITLTIAVTIAFLLEPGVESFMKLRLPRGVASFVVCSISLMGLYLAGLGLYSQGVAMADDLPAYSARMNEIVDNAAARMDRVSTGVYRSLVPRRFQDDPPQAPEQTAANPRKKGTKQAPADPPLIQEVRLRPEPTNFLSYLSAYLSSFYDVLLMASFVPFLVYFLLAWRDHLRSRLLAMLEGESRYTVAKALDGVGEMVRAYVIGNFALGMLLSVLSAILFASVKLPYWPIVGPISGFLSLAPYVGLPMALVPPLIAALTRSNDPALYLFLAASVGLLHLLAINLLYPKLVGSRVHLNPLVVTIALMFWGTIWGGIGLLLAIPLTAGLKAVCDNVSTLQAYGNLLGD